MNVLGIETSCDETSVAIVRDGREILSNIISSQADLHALYGGVVPEIASRRHVEAINPSVEQALSQAGLGWDGLDAVAVTNRPGLVGALLSAWRRRKASPLPGTSQSLASTTWKATSSLTRSLTHRSKCRSCA